MLDPHVLAKLEPLLADPAIVGDMEALSRRGRPAVEAIGAQLAAFSPGLGNADKQHVGRLVRDVLAARGWMPRRKARVAPGKLFSWGAVYGRSNAAAAAPGEAPGGTKAMDAIRAIVTRSGVTLPTVDAFIEGRRSDWGE